MALRLRGVTVNKVGEPARWAWFIDGHRWIYEQHPRRQLWRRDLELTSLIDEWGVLCLDDALVASLGFERGHEQGLLDWRDLT